MKLVDRTLAGFLGELGSDSPAPGGGSAAALAGAAAAALCEMVCRLTLSRESSRDAWPAMQEAIGEAQRAGTRLRGLIDEDADAYLAVVSARALPRSTTEEKEARKAARQAAALRAASTPLETLDCLCTCIGLVELLAKRGNASCITDTGSAGALLRAGAVAAAYNVRINLPALADEALRGSLERRTGKALAEIQAAADRIAQDLENRLDQRSTQ